MTAREMDATTRAAAEANDARMLLLCELHFTPIIRMHSGVGDFVWNSNTFLGVGDLGSVSEINESTELSSWSLQLTLSGINPALISAALSQPIQGRPGYLWLAFLDIDNRLEGEPIGPWAGRMDNTQGELGEEGIITLRLNHHLADWERPRLRRYTDADQQEEYPGDRGLEFMPAMQEVELQWGPLRT